MFENVRWKVLMSKEQGKSNQTGLTQALADYDHVWSGRRFECPAILQQVPDWILRRNLRVVFPRWCNSNNDIFQDCDVIGRIRVGDLAGQDLQNEESEGPNIASESLLRLIGAQQL